MFTKFLTNNFSFTPKERSRRPEVFCKIGVLEILQNSQENSWFRDSFFNKVAGLRPATLLKKSL